MTIPTHTNNYWRWFATFLQANGGKMTTLSWSHTSMLQLLLVLDHPALSFRWKSMESSMQAKKFRMNISMSSEEFDNLRSLPLSCASLITQTLSVTRESATSQAPKKPSLLTKQLHNNLHAYLPPWPFLCKPPTECQGFPFYMIQLRVWLTCTITKQLWS